MKTLLQRFDEDYFLMEVSGAPNHPTAFEIANQKFEAEHTFPAFDSYDSFRTKKARAKKKSKK